MASKNADQPGSQIKAPKRSHALLSALLFVISTGFVLVLTEVFLRYQPFVTLDYPQGTIKPEDRVSYLYHHRTLLISDPQVVAFGDCAAADARHVKILFLGDSWMELTDGIPRGFAESLLADAPAKICYDVVNGGTTSFAPSLTLVKGRKLIAEQHPDFVVVYVDETDIMDEAVRYSRTTLRSADGKIERVVPGFVDLATFYERSILAQQRFYTLRLLEQLYYDYVFIPRVDTAVLGGPESVGAYERIMALQLADDPETTYKAELEYFRGNVHEMLATFVELVGAERILVARHPHYLHLSIGGKPPRYHYSLSKLLATETSVTGVDFYDAGDHLMTIYGDDPPHYMKWPADPFSHLTPEGFRKFGAALGQYEKSRFAALDSHEDP